MALGRRRTRPPTGGPGSRGAGRGPTRSAATGRGPVPGRTAVPTPSRGERARQLKTAFSLTRTNDRRLIPYLALAVLLPIVVLVGLGLLLGHPILLGVLSVPIALLAAVVVFGRRVQKTAYAQVEGQLGAAAAVLQNMRGDWRVTPAVGFTREQDLLHRVVGRPGVILVAEGSPQRGRGLIVTEKRRVARVIGDTPVYEVLVGDADGMVALRALERHLLKLPRNIKPRQVNIVDQRLTALGGASLPIPKGPMPRGGRVPRGKMR